jgi:hypothetical protein
MVPPLLAPDPGVPAFGLILGLLMWNQQVEGSIPSALTVSIGSALPRAGCVLFRSRAVFTCCCYGAVTAQILPTPLT